MPHHYQYGSQPNRYHTGANRCTQDYHSPSEKCRNQNPVNHTQTVALEEPVLLQDKFLEEALDTFVYKNN